MGWAEASRPKPITRADLARELAAAIAEDIPGDMSAEAAWPLLIRKARAYREHSETLNTTAWKLAVALGHVETGDGEAFLDFDALLAEGVAVIEEARP